MFFFYQILMNFEISYALKFYINLVLYFYKCVNLVIFIIYLLNLFNILNTFYYIFELIWKWKYVK